MRQLTPDTFRRVVIPAREQGKTLARDEMIDRTVLALLFDAGGEMCFHDLWQAMPITRRELWQSLNRQYTLGNVKRHREGEPLILTASARMAIAAGRERLEMAA